MTEDVQDDGEAEFRRRLELFEEINLRCGIAGIVTEEAEGWVDDGPCLVVHLPCGRDTRSVVLDFASEAQDLLNIAFESYRFVPGYDAVFRPDSGDLEVELRVLGSSAPNGVPPGTYPKLFGRDDQFFRPKAKEWTVSSDGGHIPISVSLQPTSATLSGLLLRKSRLSLLISRQGLSTAEEAERLLLKVTNALFFQIDMLSDIGLGIVRERHATPRTPRKGRVNIPESVQFPTMEYEEAPVSLYWYGRNAAGMPLLQFLAFYQVIEYFYPVYSRAEANRRVQHVLKDPGFRADRDSDVNRLLTVIQTGKGGGFFDERSQLKATLAECLDADDLRTFLSEDPNRLEWFKGKDKPVNARKIPMNDVRADLVSEVAERIYEIRCKIVHTKNDSGGGEVELLLPYSKEAAALSYDIELVRYACQKVLISASVPFQA